MESKSVEQRNFELSILDTYTRVLGFELPREILMGLYFSLPHFVSKWGDFDLADLAFAKKQVAEVMREEQVLSDANGMKS